MTRVVREQWFADVPRGCEWVGDASTSMDVSDADASPPPPPLAPPRERLEMCGCVVARREGRAVVSCGGMFVSVPDRGPLGGRPRVRIVFTRGAV